MFFVLCKPIWSIYLFSVHPIQKTCETSILTTTNIFSFLSLCFEFWTFCASFSKTQICSKTTKHLKWWVKRAKAFTEFDSVLLTKMIPTGLKRPFDTINLKTLLKNVLSWIFKQISLILTFPVDTFEYDHFFLTIC